MTKKDFEIVADTLARLRPSKALNPKSHSTWALIVLRLTERFQKEYPGFDAAKFLHTCYEEVE